MFKISLVLQSAFRAKRNDNPHSIMSNVEFQRVATSIIGDKYFVFVMSQLLFNLLRSCSDLFSFIKMLLNLRIDVLVRFIIFVVISFSKVSSISTFFKETCTAKFIMCAIQRKCCFSRSKSRELFFISFSNSVMNIVFDAKIRDETKRDSRSFES